MAQSQVAVEEPVIHILWINAGLSCDGDSVALTAATAGFPGSWADEETELKAGTAR